MTDGVASSHELASYLPQAILLHYASSGAQRAEAVAKDYVGSVLVADISGFTKISEQLAEQGPDGAERLTVLLNAYFGRVINRISAHGGDIVRFAGDAVLAIWCVDTPEAVSQAVQRAAQCGMALQQELRDYTTEDGERLTIKIGIGCGEYRLLHLGGVLDRWEYLVTGIAFAQAFSALERAQPRQVVASLRAWYSLRSEFQGEPLPMGSVLITSGSELAVHEVSSPARFGPELQRAAACFIPAAVTSRLDSTDAQWIGEHRYVSVLFATLPELNYATPLESAQEIMKAVQTEVYRYEGSVNKLNVDEKGTSLLAAWGLPPMAHEDDARRAVQSALSLSQSLRNLGLRSSIGVSAGHLFCGIIGSDLRREYTLLGDVVNRAARLMQAALGEVLCDEATYRATRSRIQYQPLGEVQIKGKSQRLLVYDPKGLQSAPSRAHKPLVGRDSERERILAHIAIVHQGKDPVCILIEAEAGVGKSSLLRDVGQSWRAAGMRVVSSSGDEMERGHLYHVWAAIFEQLLGLEPEATARSRQERLLQFLNNQPDVLPLAPLANDLLGMNFPENEITQHMVGDVRAENTRALWLELLRIATAEAPLILQLDEAQAFDSASWALTLAAARRIPRLAILLGHRPLTERVPDDYLNLLAADQTLAIRLEPLSRDQTAELIRLHVGVEQVAAGIIDHLHSRAEGNPWLTEELLERLLAADYLNLAETKCEIAKPLPPHEDQTLPETLQGLITSRIDRLNTSQQLTVKVASVQGRNFALPVLHGTYPVGADRAALLQHLETAQAARLLEPHRDESELAYMFKHVITQQVSYGLLLYSQRQQMHRSIALWYEARDDSSQAVQVMLARHWRLADERHKAVRYLDKAGESALRSGAYQEAVDLFCQATEFEGQQSKCDSPLATAARHRQLGEAQLGLGRISESRSWFQKSLAQIQVTEPGKTSLLLASLLAQLTGRGLLRLIPKRLCRILVARGDVAERRLEAARNYERLTVVYFLTGQKLEMIHASVRCANLAQRTTTAPELAKAYATNCLIAGFAQLHRMAQNYAESAVEIARRLGDPSALGWVLEVTSIYRLGYAKFAEAQAGLDEALTIFTKLRDRQHWCESIAASAQVAYYQGHFSRGLALWKQLYENARQRGDELHQAWSLNGRSEAALREFEGAPKTSAVQLLEEALILFEHNVDRTSQLGSYGLLAQAHLKNGDRQAARQVAAEGLRLADQLGSPTSYYCLEGYSGIATTYLTLLELEPAGKSGDAAAAKQACKFLNRYARIFAIGRPSALRCRGTRDWLRGKQRRARIAWLSSIWMAQQLGMAWEEARTHFEIARHLPPSDPKRDHHVDEANVHFRSLGLVLPKL